MNLPRNIVQIGEVNKTHKIFVEDYVLSYIKQQIKEDSIMTDKPKKVVLYGKEEKEKGVTYYFIYGAIVLKEESFAENIFTTKERGEAREYGELFFKQPIKGYFELTKELPDGFFMLEGLEGKFRQGYACFYEKNETMLAFMLEQKEQKEEKNGEEAPLEIIEKPIKKEESVRTKQLYYYQKHKKQSTKHKRGHVGYAVLSILAVMVALRYGSSLEGIKESIKATFLSMEEQKIPNKEDEYVDFEQWDITESLVLEENKANQEEKNEEEPLLEESSQEESPLEERPQEELPLEESPKEEIKETLATDSVEVKEYTIQKGDTLLSISWNTYGSIEKVQEICDYNEITDADSIQVGQTIFLP